MKIDGNEKKWKIENSCKNEDTKNGVHITRSRKDEGKLDLVPGM